MSEDEDDDIANGAQPNGDDIIHIGDDNKSVDVYGQGGNDKIVGGAGDH